MAKKKKGTWTVVVSKRNPNKKAKFVYMATCILDLPDHKSKDIKKYSPDKRNFGWFPSFKRADEAVQCNYGDIHECSYMYAVIEKVEDGFRINHTGKEWWYKWDYKEEGFRPIEKPKEWERIIGFWG